MHGVRAETSEKCGMKWFRLRLHSEENRVWTRLIKNWASARLPSSFWFIFLGNEASGAKTSFYIFDLFSLVQQLPTGYLFLSNPPLATFNYTWLYINLQTGSSRKWSFVENTSFHIFDLFFHMVLPAVGLCASSMTPYITHTVCNIPCCE